MEYASSAWSPHTDHDIKKLEQVQKNAARFVTGDYRLTTSTAALVKSVGWDPLEKRCLIFQAYEALTRPQMEYASSAWSPHTDHDINKLEQVQKNAARFVTGDYRLTTSTTALVKSVGWDPLEKRCLIFQVTMLYKIRNKLVNFSIPADIGSQTRSRSSRAHGHAYRQLGINVQSHGYSFPRVIRVWNSLPLETVTSKISGPVPGFGYHLH